MADHDSNIRPQGLNLLHRRMRMRTGMPGPVPEEGLRPSLPVPIALSSASCNVPLSQAFSGEVPVKGHVPKPVSNSTVAGLRRVICFRYLGGKDSPANISDVCKM